MGFCDFESVLQRNKERSKCRLCSRLECLCSFPTSDDINVHRPVGYSLIFVESYNEVFFQEEYLGEDAAKRFLDRLPLYEQIVGERKQKFRDVLKTKATQEEWQMFRKATVCHICVLRFATHPKKYRKVLDHDHVTGKIMGAAHSLCNLGSFNDGTKTAVASLLARPFDPLGMISPFILLARKILKQTFEENLGWKDKLSGEMLESWQRWLSYLPDLEKVTAPRHVPFTPDTELHVFGDAAANMGHGVAAYAHTPVGNNRKFESHLLFAKSRINPKRDITVPRLELVASLLCAQTAEMLHKELGIAKGKIYCYSDSELRCGG